MIICSKSFWRYGSVLGALCPSTCFCGNSKCRESKLPWLLCLHGKAKAGSKATNTPWSTEQRKQENWHWLNQTQHKRGGTGGRGVAKQEELKKHALYENCHLDTEKGVSRAFSWCGLALISADLADTVNWAWPRLWKCLNFSFRVRLKAYVSGSNGIEPHCSAHDFDEPQVMMTVPSSIHIISE